MQTNFSDEVILEASTSYHHKLTNGLDNFEQEYQVRNIVMPQNVALNLTELRGIIESTINEDVLADRFLRALNRMGTWQEFFVIFGFDDLAIKYYMKIIISSFSKDTMIANLKASVTELRTQIEIISKENDKNMKDVDNQNKISINALKRDFDIEREKFTEAIDISNKEVRLLREELKQIHEMTIGVNSNQILALKLENNNKANCIKNLQQELISYRRAAVKDISFVGGEETKDTINSNNILGEHKV